MSRYRTKILASGLISRPSAFLIADWQQMREQFGLSGQRDPTRHGDTFQASDALRTSSMRASMSI